MARKPKDEDQFSDQESQRRFEAALRGARAVGHKQMKDIIPKRHKPATRQSAERRSKPK
jgi:hypothetical protein